MSRLAIVAALAASLSTTGGQGAWAWGNTGHRIAGVAAVQALPKEVPAFVRAPAAATEIGELSREPDRAKAKRVTDAMLQMVKIDIAGLQAAAAAR